MTQNKLPAPYELDQSQSSMPMAQQAQPYARGGRTSRHKGLIEAHVSPHELTIMDHLQGGMKPGPGGIRSYPGLEELLKNPHLSHTIHRHAHAHRHANGGMTGRMEHLREGGRNGDTELALIGPHTHHFFNQLAGHATRNPNTGHPEYFDIGGALSGLWNTVKGIGAPIMDTIGGLFNSAKPALTQIAQNAAPTLLPMAQQALGDKFGAAGQMAGNMLGQGAQQFLGQPSGEQNPYYQAIGQGIGQAAKGYAGGANPSQAFGQGLQHFGSQIGGGVGNALQESGQQLGQGSSWGQAARSGAQRGFNELGGRQGLYNSANRIGQGLIQGGFGGARQAAGNEMSQYMQRAMPRPANQGYGQQRYNQQSFDPYEEDPYELYG
ncbi:MAG TPA: hypothetical protein VNZ45_02450 [Bacteroidia bacterium]|nr:hypothetical protein [Bacteroidia bacterium]